MNTEALNSKAYWEQRFDTDWETLQGCEQSRFFARLAVENLPGWFKRLAVSQKLTFCDWGCAEGDGTDVLASFFGRDHLSGVDFSEKAVEKAQRHYGDLVFKAEDWLTANGTATRYDVVFSSNTLEHFQRPYDVLARIAEHADKFIVLLLPYREFDRHPEHYHTFISENIPFLPSADFVLVHARAVDTRAIKPTYWAGEQVVLIYARRQWLESCNLTLDDIQIGNQALLDEVKQLKTLNDALTETVAERGSRIECLNKDVAEQEERIAVLTQAVVERDSRMEVLTQVATQNDGQIASLNEALSERDKQYRMVINSRSWHVTRPLRFVTRAARHLAGINVSKAIKMVARRLASHIMMNWYEYLFDVYRRSRDQHYPADWKSVQVPHIPGMVSIVLPCYNGADLLAESIESVLAQTYQNFELIAINDGSFDATGHILEEYAVRDSRIRVYHQENQKLPRTLSRGFHLARGEYLTWTSVDNRMKSVCLEKLVACLRRHPDWDMVYANVDIIGEDGKPLYNSSWYSSYQCPHGSEHVYLPRCTAELNIWPNNYIGAAFMYRSRVAWLIGDYSPVRYCTEDYDYWMRVNATMKLRHVDFNDCIYDYRFHSKSLTSRDEELGITSNRVKLMVFEDFRRSFYLGQVIWVINRRTESSAARSLEKNLAAMGHLMIGLAELQTYQLPSLWLPVAYVCVTDDFDIQLAPDALPEFSLTVLIHVGDEPPVRSPPSGWKMCVTTATDKSVIDVRNDSGFRGWFGIKHVPTLIAAIDLRAKNLQLAEIELETDRLMSEITRSSLKLSVVICTYRRSHSLLNVLQSVSEQTLPKTEYEIIIVNNEPRETYPATVAEEIRNRYFEDFSDHLKFIDCPVPSLSYARNVGISEASGEVVLFIDDDAIAKPDCLEWITHAYANHPDAGIIGGHIHLKVPDPLPTVLKPGREALWSQFLTSFQEYTLVEHWWEFPWGANWSARRRVLYEIGGFRINFGRSRNDFGGGEELVAAALAKQLGYAVGIEPRAKVLHDVEHHRYTEEHVRKTLRSAILVRYQMQKNFYIPMEASLIQSFRILLARVKSLLKRIVSSQSMDQTGSIDVNIPIDRIQVMAEMSAYADLLKTQIFDLLARIRRPVTSD